MRHAPPLTVRRQPTSGAVLLVAAFGAFLAFLDSTIVNVAFPDMAREFPRSSVGSLSWVLNSYNVVFAAFVVAAGKLADLLGRRRTFCVGVAVFTGASALCALAPSVGALIVSRVVQGVGAALLVPASLALVVEAFPADRRAHGIGLWGASAAIAAGLGPPVGGLLVASSSWRLAFLVNVPLGVVAVVIARRALVESRAPGRRRVPDLRGALLLAVALGTVTSAVVKGPDWGWRSGGVLLLCGVAVVATGGFLLSSRRHPAPVLDAALLRLRGFGVGTVATTIAGMGFYAYLLTHILWLHYVWQYSLLRAGFAVAPGALVAAAVAAVLGRVADQHGHVRIIVPGALVWTGGLLWYVLQVGVHPDFLGTWLPGQLLSGVGVGATLPLLSSGALVTVPRGEYATASAVLSSARQLGAVLGIATLVAIIGQRTGTAAVHALRVGWGFSAACFAVVALGAPGMGRTAAARRAAGSAESAGAAPAPVPAPEPRSAAVSAPSVLSSLSPAAADQLRDGAVPLRLQAGQLLFRQGDESDAAYLVRSGRLRVLDGAHTVAVVGAGTVLGELGLLTGGPRSASVRAVRDCTLWRLSAQAFRDTADEEVLLSVATVLAGRLQAVAQPALPHQPGVVISVLPAHDGAPAPAVTRRLLTELSRDLRVVAPGRVGAAQLARLERDFDRVLLVSDSTVAADTWPSTCQRVADQVIVVSSAPRPLGRRLPAGCHLVLTGGAPDRADALAWAAACAPRSITVLPRDGLRALSARLAQRSLAVAFAGGGARAFAHLGVLEVLEDAGIPVDRVAGTSVGAAIAALHALGMSAAEVDAWCYEYFVRSSPIGDVTLPTKGLIKGRRTQRAIRLSVGDTVFEQLPRDLRVVSVDLLARERVVHRTGSVADAVSASLRLPGLYPPLALAGRLHVDGGVLDNLPVSALQDPAEGPVVAVSISFGGAGGAATGHGGGCDTDGGAAGRAGRPVRVPGVAETLMRTMMMGSAQAAAAAVAAADVVIRPASLGVGLLEFHQIDRMKEAGRVAARAALPAVAAALSGRPAVEGAREPGPPAYPDDPTARARGPALGRR